MSIKSSVGNALQEMQLNTLNMQRTSRMKAALAANPERVAAPAAASVTARDGARKTAPPAAAMKADTPRSEAICP